MSSYVVLFTAAGLFHCELKCGNFTTSVKCLYGHIVRKMSADPARSYFKGEMAQEQVELLLEQSGFTVEAR